MRPGQAQREAYNEGLKDALDNIIQLKQEHEIAAKAVKDLVDIARANGDKITTNTTNIKTFKRGIKEIYEDEPRIVDAINKVGRVEMHTLLLWKMNILKK